MTSNEAYQKFLFEVNKNDTNSNVKISKAQFVLSFNREKRLFIDTIIKNNEGSDYIEDIQELLVLDKKLDKLSTGKLNDSFKLPEDFSRRATMYIVASKGECKDNVMVVWPIKPKNKDIYLQNSNLNPSFEYQETIGILNSNNLTIYKTDFKIDEAYLNYYKEANDIDLEGYRKIDGTLSTNIDSNLSGENVEQIISLTAQRILNNFQTT